MNEQKPGCTTTNFQSAFTQNNCIASTVNQGDPQPKLDKQEFRGRNSKERKK